MTGLSSSWSEVFAGGVRWLVRSTCQAALLGPDGLRLPEWQQDGQAQVVKHGPHRTVYRVALPGMDVYLKHYRLADARSWLRQLIRPAKARMEFDRARAVAARGIPTVVPLALGEAQAAAGAGESFLITQSLDGAESLFTFLQTSWPSLEPARRTRIRLRLAVALGQLVARMHEAGITHHDLHAANVLVRLDALDRPSLYLIDLHAVCLGQPLGWQASRDNLVLLNHWFILQASRSDRRRFWRAYVQGRRWPVAESRPRIAELERTTWDSNLHFWAQRERRYLEDNREYSRLRTPSLAGHAVRDLEPAALSQLLADPDAPFHQPGIRLLKDSRSSTVAELRLPVNGEIRPVIYKRFRVTSRLAPLANLLRRSPALRSWVFGHGLRDRFLRTPRPLAVFHRRRGGLPHEGYLIVEKIQGARDLHRVADSLRCLDAPERRKHLRPLLDELATLVRELHRRHLTHRDLKANNILVNAEGVWLIDLVGVRSRGRMPREACVQNLARLHASFHQDPLLTRTDKLRFLRTYLQLGLLGRQRWKRWWREIETATLAKVARNTRNGRILA